jgi:hypothetical protein
MSDSIPQVKKRGRKPKNKVVENKISQTPINSDEETIIAHLPISLEDVVNIGSNDFYEDTKTEENNMFIKSESDFTNVKFKEKIKEINIIPNKTEESEDKLLEKINQKILETEKIFMLGRNVNKVNVHNISFKPGTKCLWCKHTFDTPAVELPEDYFNNIFYCSGNFCSWNCAKAFNVDLNDITTWKRESLLNLMFYKTYGVFKEITPAPSWLMLEDFGGILAIKDFRSLFISNNKDYLVLHPPLITRQLQIEESYKKSSSTNANKLENLQENELVLKRSKPIESTNFNLEKTIGLRRKVKKSESN